MKTILLADDEANLRVLARITLDDPNCRILEAPDGITALDLARSERPDLLVLDWMMPGMSGIDVAQALRQDPATAHIPIIMLTAKGQDTDKAQARAAGARAYLVKPFSPLELLQKINEIWRQSAGALEAESVGAISELPEPPAEVQRQLSTPNSQLALYARDLRRTVDAERQKARELAEANRRLQLLDRMKTEFLSFISHELRTPLNIIGAVGIFDPHADPREQTEVIGIIRRGYERLTGFVETGLEYFNWLALEQADTAEVTDLAHILGEAVGNLPALHDPAVEFRLDAQPGPCLTRGEKRHWARVLRTLLDNALKFSPGQKSVHVTLHAADARATLSVRDRGQGFPPEFAPELFRPFTTPNPLNHSRGTGLSLALARVIVEAYGGHIRAESRGCDTGATFTIDVPAAAQDR